MTTDRPSSDIATADVILWQTSYRLVLALLVGAVAITFRLATSVPISPVANAFLGGDAADWLLGVMTGVYTFMVIAVRSTLRTRRRAGALLSSLVVGADVLMVSAVLFVLAPPSVYHLGLLIGLFSLQLTHLYFGRRPALSMLVVTIAVYLLLSGMANMVEPVDRVDVIATMIVYSLGGLLVVGTQSDLQTRLGVLVHHFDRAEEGDFTHEYDVARDRRPDAVTAVGRAYNRLKVQLENIVAVDPLTGCFNRRSFEQQYHRELARSMRAGTPLSLLVLDLDAFKQINDTHGHLVGDQVLGEVGALLRENARADDVVARTGGEEFTIIAPNTPPEGALFLALRLVENFRQRHFLESSARVPVRISVGVTAETISDAHAGEAMRARAEEALYAAKRQGRDRAVAWSPSLDALRAVQAAAQASVSRGGAVA